MILIRYIVGVFFMVLGWSLIDSLLDHKIFFDLITVKIFAAFMLFSIGNDIFWLAKRGWPWDVIPPS